MYLKADKQRKHSEGRWGHRGANSQQGCPITQGPGRGRPGSHRFSKCNIGNEINGSEEEWRMNPWVVVVVVGWPGAGALQVAAFSARVVR